MCGSSSSPPISTAVDWTLFPSLSTMVTSRIAWTLPLPHQLTLTNQLTPTMLVFDMEGSQEIMVQGEATAEPRCCINVVKMEFLQLNPVLTRRLKFYRTKQADGQMFSDWVRDLHRRGDQCCLESLSTDDVYVFQYLTGVRDHKLQKEMLQVTDPTVEKLDSVVEKYEVSLLFMKGLHISSQAKNNAVTGQGGKTNPKGRPQPVSSKGKATSHPVSGSSSQHKSSQNTSTGQYNCFRCGSKNREHSSAVKNTVCKFCKKKGHFQSACNSKAGKGQTAGASMNAATSK